MGKSDYVTKSMPDTRWATFRLLFFFFVLAASLGSWLLFSAGKEKEIAEPVEVRVLSLRELYAQALPVAIKWRPDAILDRANLWFRPLQQPGTMRASLGFRSPSAPDEWLNVYIRVSSSGTEIEAEEGGFPVPRQVGNPIYPEELPFDSQRALEIVLRSGGEAYLLEHPDPDWPLSLILEYRDLFHSEGPLVWRGIFSDKSGLAAEHIRIDAYTGLPIE
jgi:hypothetical protein